MSMFPVVPESQLLPGDIIFFQNTWWAGVSHVAIYIGHGKVIHAENPGAGVTISRLRNDPRTGDYWQQHYLQAERPWNGPVPDWHTGHILTVLVPSLNLRSDHSFSAGVVTVVTQGQLVHVEGWYPGWVRVKAPGGAIGWVVRSGVARNPGVGSTPPSSTGSAPQSGARRAAWANAKTVYVFSLRVHSAPALSAPVVAMLSRGNRVGVFLRQGGWDKILLVDGIVGWAMAQYVGKSVPSSTKKSGNHGAIHPVGHTPLRSGVNLRSTASMSSPITAVSNGLPVRVLHWSSGWADVQLTTGASGWVWRAFLGHRAPTNAPSPSAGKSGPHVTATVRLHVRPGLNARVIGVVTAGSRLTILRYASGWDFVRTASGATGYVSAAYVVR